MAYISLINITSLTSDQKWTHKNLSAQLFKPRYRRQKEQVLFTKIFQDQLKLKITRLIQFLLLHTLVILSEGRSVFERRILRIIFDQIQENYGKWRTRMSFELYQLMQEEIFVRIIRSKRLQWFGHMQQCLEIASQFTNLVSSATWGIGRLSKRWKD